MKSYTDFEQSKKLAEILPLESADMCWTNHCYGAIRSSMTISAKTVDEYKSLLDRFNDSASIDVFYPAWSLAALLNVIPSDIKGNDSEDYILEIEKCDKEHLPYGLNYHDNWGRGEDIITHYYDNLIDACVEMILKLHELNLL